MIIYNCVIHGTSIIMAGYQLRNNNNNNISKSDLKIHCNELSSLA